MSQPTPDIAVYAPCYFFEIVLGLYDMMEDDRADKTKEVVEWYKTETEMLCLVKMKEHETIH